MSLAAALAADGGRPASFLPAIKCSNCGDEIEIAAMGEHVCGRRAESPKRRQHQQYQQYQQQQPPPQQAQHGGSAFTLRQMNAVGLSQQPQPQHQHQHQHQPAAPSPLRQNPSASHSRARAGTVGSKQQAAAPKATRPPPPRINPDAANQPFLPPSIPAPASPASPSWSSRSGGKPPMPPILRSMTNPGPRLWDPRPPSPELSANLDCAFPPFPVSTPTSTGSGSRPGTSHGRSTPTLAERAPSRSSNKSRTGDRVPYGAEPKSPRGNENMMKRMDTLKSGPFDGTRRKASGGDIPSLETTSVSRKPSDTMSAGKPEEPFRRPSTAASNHSFASRRPSDRRAPPPRPTRPQESEALSPTFLDTFSSEPLSDFPSALSQPRTIATGQGEDRSRTFPVRKESDGEQPYHHDDGRRPSDMAMGAITDRQHDVQRSPHRIASPDSQQSFPLRGESRGGSRLDTRLGGAPPVPRPVQQHRQDSFHTPSESGSSTTSSLGNSNSSGGPSPASSAASSIDAFSPFSQEARSFTSEKDVRPRALTVKSKQKPGERAEEKSMRSPPRHYAQPASYTRSEHPVLAEPLSKPSIPIARPMDSPTDPMLQARNPNQPVYQAFKPASAPPSHVRPPPPHPGLLRTQTAPIPEAPQMRSPPPPGEYGEYDPYRPPERQLSQQSRSRSKSNASEGSQYSQPFSPQDAPPLPFSVPRDPPPTNTSQPTGPHHALARKGTTAKPTCRGCGFLIEGKSVKAADGRLTGRWHKTCFTCRSCRQPFATADFYVIDNHPYCEQHYHEKNGSLCHGCHRGIEGQYLETMSPSGAADRKFHPRCFTCVDCRQILSDDYFEIAGRVYCERHALAAMRGQARMAGSGANRTPGSSLNPNANWKAERRTTRLMMM